MEQRVHYVRVTNHGDQPFTDRWDGIPVSIGPGKSDNLQLDMAGHFFGYHPDAPQDVMFLHVCKRQGWNTPADIKPGESGKTVAEEKFAKLEIKPIVYKMVEVEPDLDAPIPADPVYSPLVDKTPAPQPSKKMDADELPALPRRKAGST